MMNQRAVSQYQQVNTQANVASATPHRLIQMLMEGFLQRVAEAKGHMERGDLAGRGEALGKAISIIGGLRSSLNQEVGGELVANLDAVYGYIEERLLLANTKGDITLLDEVASLMHTVKDGWDSIADQVG